MAAEPYSSEKAILIDPYAPSIPTRTNISFFSPVAPFYNVYDRFSQWRTDLGLPNPGTVENLQKEVKGAVFHFRYLQKASAHSYNSQ